MSDRVMALAGVLQATELARQGAVHGTWSGFAAEASLESLLALESESVRDIYGGPARLRVGLDTLGSILRGDNQHIDALRYAVALFQLERRLHRNEHMQGRIAQELSLIADQHDTDADETARRAARVYTATISTLKPQIVVNGKPRYLQDERIVSWIRTLLFSGLRSAVLWRQLGGGRFALLFGRKKLLAELAELTGH